MFEVPLARFEELVAEALDSLPEQFGVAMENVAVVVDDVARGRPLLGLYQGVPLTKRGNSYAGTMPDQITLYRLTICSICSTDAEVAEQIQKTLIHEVAHHFGIDDPRLDELGW